MSNLLLITLFNVSIFFKYKYLKAKLNFNKKNIQFINLLICFIIRYKMLYRLYIT